MGKGVSETLTASIEVGFPEFLDPPDSPLPLLESRITRARDVGVREPLALALATVAAGARPSVRTVAVLGVTGGGVLFATHTTSRKGREIAENPRVGGLLYWRETSEQIAVAGRAELLGEDVADERWNARPAATHAMSVATRQSAVLEDVDGLRTRAGVLMGDAPLPRPESYRVYEIRLTEVEFWADGQDRLHERLAYSLDDGVWTARRLQP